MFIGRIVHDIDDTLLFGTVTLFTDDTSLVLLPLLGEINGKLDYSTDVSVVVVFIVSFRPVPMVLCDLSLLVYPMQWFESENDRPSAR